MSMYTELLGAAFGHTGSGEETTAGEALAELLRVSGRLGVASELSRTGTGWAPAAVADQLAYDVALLRLSRALGIACEPAAFDPPEPERARLEEALASRGVPLGELGRRADSATGGS